MRLFALILSTILFLVLTTPLSAQELVYYPKNPAFGGNPGNYSWLKASADTQNLFEEEVGSSRFQRDPLDDFKNSLQRQILSQITRDIVLRQFGEGEQIQESRFEFGEFIIEVIPGLDGVQILISNILTGDETSIRIPNF